MLYLGHFQEWLKQNWMIVLPILLLHLLAWRQMILSRYDYLDPWKGGGFGMFSTSSNRFYHIHLISKEAFECAEPPEAYYHQLKKVQSYPSYLKLELAARALTAGNWVYDYKNDGAPPSLVMLKRNQPISHHHKMVPFDSVELQVFDFRFSKRAFTVEPQLLRKLKCLK